MLRPLPSRWLAVIIAVLALPVGGRAAPAAVPLSQWAHQQWDARADLPVGAVNGVLAARSGYVWFGTEEGLVRFDGHRFVVFDRGRAPGLSGNFVSVLLEGPSGEIWLGTWSGLSRMRGRAIERVPLGPDDVEARVTALELQGEDLWVGTHGRGLFRLHAGRWTACSRRRSPRPSRTPSRPSAPGSARTAATATA